jgi:hypothetical protein
MEAMPNASLKDLLSTGYFYNELKTYIKSTEIDLCSYSRNYAIPYLSKLLERNEGAGEIHRNEILALAVDCLTNAKDEDLTAAILELKSITTSEIDDNEKVLHQLGSEDKVRLKTCRHKSESAQTLSKLLVSIIKMFKLAEPTPKRGASKAVRGVFDLGPELPEPM